MFSQVLTQRDVRPITSPVAESGHLDVLKTWL